MEGCEGGVAQAFWCTDALIPGIRGDDKARVCVHPLREKKSERQARCQRERRLVLLVANVHTCRCGRGWDLVVNRGVIDQRS